MRALAFAAPFAAETRPARTILVLATILALVIAGATALGPPAMVGDPDLARVLRFMAAMKGIFALAGLAACYWRLGRPATAWRVAIYVAGPPAMAGGALALFFYHDVALAAGSLHLGLFAVLAAMLTDRDFLPDFNLR